jgi:hypothetical protein
VRVLLARLTPALFTVALHGRGGVIWVHLDDAEVHRCRSVIDEEVGGSCFLGTVIWQKVRAHAEGSADPWRTRRLAQLDL